MKEFFPVLHTAALFSGISDDELAAMLSCLGARIDTFPKGSRLLRAGEAVEEVGLVLAGSVLIVQEDIWGNRNILSKAGPGQTFAEVFACAPQSAPIKRARSSCRKGRPRNSWAWCCPAVSSSRSTRISATAAVPAPPPVTRAPSPWWTARRGSCGTITATAWVTACPPAPPGPSPL